VAAQVTPDAAAQLDVPGGRNGGLDIIRATGAALVFATHLYHSYGQAWLGPLASGGYTGVFLFFPLSGYLLYRPFVIGRVDLRRYAIARVARIAPAYYLAAIVISLSGVSAAMAAHPLVWGLFAVNLFPSPNMDNFGQAWTLGVEVAFYALLPFVAKGKGLTLALLTLTSYLFWLSTTEVWWNLQLPTLFWAFGAGMLVARYQDRLRLLARFWPLGVVLVVAGVLRGADMTVRGHDLTTLGAALLILGAATVRPGFRWARWPADLSYGVYLWHPAISAAVLLTGLSGLPMIAVAVAGTCAIAAASFVVLERPVLRWALHPYEAHPELRAIGRVRAEEQGTA